MSPGHPSTDNPSFTCVEAPLKALILAAGVAFGRIWSSYYSHIWSTSDLREPLCWISMASWSCSWPCHRSWRPLGSSHASASAPSAAGASVVRSCSAGLGSCCGWPLTPPGGPTWVDGLGACVEAMVRLRHDDRQPPAAIRKPLRAFKML